MRKIYALLAGLLFVLPATLCAAPARAEEDITPLFCDGMDREEVYDAHKFDAYKMLRPGTDGWIFRSQSDLRSDFTLTREGLENIEDLAAAFRARGTELVLLLVPTRGLVHHKYLTPEDRKKYKFTDVDAVWDNYRSAIKSLQNNDIHAIGLARPADDAAFFYKRDHHWNAKGAKAAADAVAAYIKKMDAYEDVEKIPFATRDAGDYEFYGVSKKVFKKICNTSQPPEYAAKKVTERQDGAADGEEALFGDAKNPEIVLLGTSNSTQEPSQANFEGFLKEALSADILNMSVSGGGMETAVISYLNSDFFRTRPAKIAIWEIPGYYDMSSYKTFFREVIPAVYGNCAGNAVAERKGLVIDDRMKVALQDLAGRRISGPDYYLHIGFSEPVAQSFAVNLQYTRDRERYKFQRSARYPRDGDFYVSLHPDKNLPLDKVVINMPPKMMGVTADVRICKQSDIRTAGFFRFPLLNSARAETGIEPAAGEPTESKSVIRKLLDKLSP